MNEIGNAIRRYRDEHGLVQAEFAQSIGISGSMLSAIELGRSQMTPHQIARLQGAHPQLWHTLAHIKLNEFARELGIDESSSDIPMPSLKAADLYQARELIERMIRDVEGGGDGH